MKNKSTSGFYFTAKNIRYNINYLKICYCGQEDDKDSSVQFFVFHFATSYVLPPRNISILNGFIPFAIIQ